MSEDVERFLRRGFTEVFDRMDKGWEELRKIRARMEEDKGGEIKEGDDLDGCDLDFKKDPTPDERVQALVAEPEPPQTEEERESAAGQAAS